MSNASSNGKATALHGGKANKAAILREAIADVGLADPPDQDKILAVARKIMERYPAGDRAEIIRNDLHRLLYDLKRGKGLPVTVAKPAPVAEAMSAPAILAEIMAPADSFTAAEIRAARACLAAFDNDTNRAQSLLALMGGSS